MSQGRFTDDAAVVLNYQDFYGKPVSVDDLKVLLSSFATDDWMRQLARLTCLLGGNRNEDPHWANAFLKYFTPPTELENVNRWFAEHQQKEQVSVVPSERHVEILLELAAIHAPDTAPKPMEFPGDERHVFDALLMVASLDVDAPASGLATADEFLAMVSTLWSKSVCPDPFEAAIRGYYIYEILRGEDRTASGMEMASLFAAATGQDIDDYFTGGFATLAVTMQRTVEELADAWISVLGPTVHENYPKLSRPLSCYTERLSADIQDIREAIMVVEPGDDVGGYNLIPLRQYPLLKYGGGVYPLSLAGIASSLLDGVYHAVITASLEKGIPESIQHVGGVFGNLYEAHVNALLRERFGDRLLCNPKRTDNGQEAADAVLLCEDGLLVFQMKGTHIPTKKKPLLRTPEALQRLLERAGFQKAIAQLKQTLALCRAGLVEGMPEFWTRSDTPIQPVVLTYERIPEFTLMKPLIKKLTAEVQVDSGVRAPVLMSTVDVENIVSLPPSDTLWAVLTEYAKSGAGEPFFNFLGPRRRADMTILGRKRNEMLNTLTEHLGLGDMELDEEEG